MHVDPGGSLHIPMGEVRVNEIQRAPAELNTQLPILKLTHSIEVTPTYANMRLCVNSRRLHLDSYPSSASTAP